MSLKNNGVQYVFCFFFFFVFFFVCIFRATPGAYGGSQARGGIGATAASYTTATATRIRAVSATYTTATAMPDPLTH